MMQQDGVAFWLKRLGFCSSRRRKLFSVYPTFDEHLMVVSFVVSVDVDVVVVVVVVKAIRK